jgi:hypothetical protein
MWLASSGMTSQAVKTINASMSTLLEHLPHVGHCALSAISQLPCNKCPHFTDESEA